jgi:hypothetical protein
MNRRWDVNHNYAYRLRFVRYYPCWTLVECSVQSLLFSSGTKRYQFYMIGILSQCSQPFPVISHSRIKMTCLVIGRRTF